MTTSQKALILIALAATAGLYFLGPTVGPKAATKPAAPAGAAAQLDFDKMQSTVTGQLSAARQQYLAGLAADVKRGDVKNQQRESYRLLAAFWKDSVPNPVLHYHYAAQLAELDNSEKSLTFAAHSILAYLPYAHNQQEQVWLANKGKQLFDKALAMNPANDSSVVGAGGCVMYGAGTEGGPMAGITSVRQVAERDSTNLFAQYMLGIGGMISGQFDKAAQRFEKVVKAQPDNIEVMFKLAEAYEQAGNMEQAIRSYQAIYNQIEVPQMKQELAKRISELQAAKTGGAAK